MRVKIHWRDTIIAAATLVILAAFPLINPCETETASVCTWNADTAGNGLGTSFTNYYGVQINHP